VVHCLNYCLWTGGVTDHMILEAAGATVIPFGIGNTRQLIDVILELRATAIHCTPSYPALIEKTLAEEGKLRPRDLGLRLGLFAGEAGLDNPAFRRQLEETWGFAARNANFGLSEVMSILGSQCDRTDDLHFHAGDAVFVELLDPATSQRQTITEGHAGELVCTHLDKQCQPLIRYRTRDVVTVTGTGPCACGRTARRFRITGRTDDMFNVRGVNVFLAPCAPSLPSGRICHPGIWIFIYAGRAHDRIEATVGRRRDLPAERWPEAAATLTEAIKRHIRAGAEITMVAFDSPAAHREAKHYGLRGLSMNTVTVECRGAVAYRHAEPARTAECHRRRAAGGPASGAGRSRARRFRRRDLVYRRGRAFCAGDDLKEFDLQTEDYKAIASGTSRASSDHQGPDVQPQAGGGCGAWLCRGRRVRMAAGIATCRWRPTIWWRSFRRWPWASSSPAR
jgi:hypothetical protein